jgi:hypothetical protein
VNNRLGNAVEELKSKYEKGKGGVETSVAAPTGAAYQEQDAKERKARKAEKAAAAQEEEEPEEREIPDDEGDEEDNDLRDLRDRRRKQLISETKRKAEDKVRGHGQYRDIVQDEFLAEMCNSDKVICHFYHRDFERCKVMHHHLEKLAGKHFETKFVKIDAEKTPFFIEKLHIRMMPTLVYFVNGVAIGKQIGFDGLSDMMPEGKEDEWPTILLAHAIAAAGMIDAEAVVDEDGEAEEAMQKLDRMRQASMLAGMEEDFSDDEV